MFKRALLALPLLALLASPSHAAGTIQYSLSQQLDQFGKPLSGCQFHTFQAGTTATPQSAFQDTGLTLPLPNPIICDASGRLPQFFLADGLIKIRLDDQFGVTQVVADNILVIGPSAGGGGGSTIDPTTIASTGDLKWSYGTQVITGWVRMNGRTIGSATSGASERANSDTQALFQYLWSADPNLAVSGGRGASSSADFSANKTIALPDLRGRVIAGLDDMGNTAAGRLTSTFFGASATVLGNAGGSQSQTLSLAQLPTGITTSGTTLNSISVSTTTSVMHQGTTNGFTSGVGFAFDSITASSTGNNNITVNATSNNTSGAAHPTVQPTMLLNVYIKL